MKFYFLITYGFMSIIILYVCEEGEERMIQKSKSNCIILYIVCVACACFFKCGYTLTCVQAYGWHKESPWPHFHLIIEADSLNQTQSLLIWLVLLTSLIPSQTSGAGIISGLPCPPCIYVNSGHQTLVLKLVKQVL